MVVSVSRLCGPCVTQRKLTRLNWIWACLQKLITPRSRFLSVNRKAVTLLITVSIGIERTLGPMIVLKTGMVTALSTVFFLSLLKFRWVELNFLLCLFITCPVPWHGRPADHWACSTEASCDNSFDSPLAILLGRVLASVLLPCHHPSGLPYLVFYFLSVYAGFVTIITLHLYCISCFRSRFCTIIFAS